MHVFLFDIDGTLIHSGGAGQAALHAAIAEEFAIDQPAQVPLHGLTDRSIASRLFERHGIEDSEKNWQRLRDAYLRSLPDWLARRQGVVLPGVVALLEQLAARHNVALGLLTGNVPTGARVKLEFYGLYHYFRFGGYGERHQRREGAACDALAAARQHLNGHVALERTYVVGDTPHDIRCARHIGSRVVAVCTGAFTADQLARESPDLLLDDLSQPAALLALLA
jgi:phosphoglycolate phosphatase-like HAD superfamily hydrolase